jgi:hypothetical protein
MELHFLKRPLPIRSKEAKISPRREPMR